MRDAPATATPHGHLDVLAAIPDAYRPAIIEQCAQQRFRKSQMIWRQGDAAEFVAFIISGKAMSTHQSPGGKIGTTGFWARGDLLGAADLGSSKKRQMSVRCLEDTLVYTLPKERFYDIARRFPELAESIIRALSDRLRWVAHLAVTLETQPAFQRVCGILLVLTERYAPDDAEGGSIEIDLTHESLGAIVGASRQFINMTLHELETQKAIRLGRRRIVVIDKAKLEALAWQR